MKDNRIGLFRKLLEALMDSLAATVRITRWQGPDIIPPPLQESAAKLSDRLGAANKLVADAYTGPPPAVACLTAMSAATKRLDAAHAEYRRRLTETPAERDEAAMDLNYEIDAVKAESHRWS